MGIEKCGGARLRGLDVTCAEGLLAPGRTPALMTVVTVRDVVLRSFTFPGGIGRLKHPSVKRAFTSIA